MIETGPRDDPRRLGQWLTGAGLALQVRRPHAGDPLPEQLDGYAALLVLGRGAEPDAPWLASCESLLRKAVRSGVPTLGIGLGAHLLATAHGGVVAPAEAGPGIGPTLVARRDAAGADPLFADVPFTPDVVQWHRDELADLPLRAVLLAASPRYAHQAFRLGAAAWGLLFHIEPDAAMVADWVDEDRPLLAELDLDPAAVVSAAAAVMDDLAEVWAPFAARFAALARGEQTGTTRPELPILPP